METTKENGGSFAVDFNENEEEEAEERGVGKSCNKSYTALKDRSIALLAGVSGGQETGKGHIYVTGNGRNVNSDSSVRSSTHNKEIMLDLVAAGTFLPSELTDSCVISDVCGEHGDLNGFTESLGQEELLMVGLEGGGGGFAGTTAASSPAVFVGRVSTETVQEMRHYPARENEGGTPESDDVISVEEAKGGGCIRTSHPPGRLPCSGMHQRNSTCKLVTLHEPDVNMPNGIVGCPEGTVSNCEQTELFSSLPLGHKHGSCDVDCEEVKVSNGGLHIVSAARSTRDWVDSNCCPKNNTDTYLDVEPVKNSGSGRCLSSGQLLCQRPGQEAPGAAELPRFLDPSKDSSITGSSAKQPSPCPSTLSDLNSDSPLSEPNTRGEEDEDCSDLCLPVRPQSLRTNPNLAVSLSCDATPLSPDDDGGFYFGDEGYEEDFRNVLEAGRRQSAPDKLPNLTEQTDSSEHKLMPKRFGIAEFFTR